MIKRYGSILSLAAAALAAASLTGCSSGNPATHPATTAKAVVATTPTTLHFVASDEAGNMALEDLGAKSPEGGPDIGDIIAFTQTLTLDGKPAGEVHVVSIGVDHKRHLSECSATMMLDGGTIQLGGVVSMEPTFTLTVLGGTGTYAGVTGTMDFDGGGDVQKMDVTLTAGA